MSDDYTGKVPKLLTTNLFIIISNSMNVIRSLRLASIASLLVLLFTTVAQA